MNDGAVDYVCRTEVNSSSTRIGSLIVPWIGPGSDCPAYHRSYPAGSKRKENATGKSGVLWRSFDLEEALRDQFWVPRGRISTTLVKIPTILPGKGPSRQAPSNSSKTQKTRDPSTWSHKRPARHGAIFNRGRQTRRVVGREALPGVT
jgi:hypothetical protein